jgi:DNA-binding IclR family transcriptional regulator
MRADPSETLGHQVPGASSARKLLSVLLCFSPERPIWTAAELSATLDVSTSTMYRYVALLREVGLLESTGSNTYGVADRVITLARAAQHGRSSLEDLSIPVMTHIRDVTEETVLVARRRRDYAYCVDRVESRQPVRLQFDRGQPMPLHRGSLARVLLAAMPRADRDLYLESIETPVSSTNAAQLTVESLDAVAETGFTQSFEEVDEGIWGAAAAIVVHGETVASIGVAAPIYRLDVRRRESIVDEIKRGAAEISQSMELRTI